MADNHISLFGTNLQTYITTGTPTYESTKGIMYAQDTWNAAVVGNSTARNTGFVAGTPISSLALNTALRQASIGSKIIGDLVAAENIGNTEVNTDGSDIITDTQTYSQSLILFLNKINQLINGEVSAYKSKYMDTTSTDPNSLYNRYLSLESITDNAIAGFKAGTDNYIVGRATYYTGGADTTIKEKIDALEIRVNELNTLELDPNVDLEMSYYTGDNNTRQYYAYDSTKSYVKRQANFVTGRIVLTNAQRIGYELNGDPDIHRVCKLKNALFAPLPIYAPAFTVIGTYNTNMNQSVSVPLLASWRVFGDDLWLVVVSPVPSFALPYGYALANGGTIEITFGYETAPREAL